MTRLWAAVCGVVLSACASGSATPQPTHPPTHTLTGQLVVADLAVGIPVCDPSRTFEDSFSDLQGGTQLPCTDPLTAPYEGLAPGAPVTVTSASGVRVGTGRLQDGVLSMHGVRYPFTVTGLPSEAAYVVTVSTVTTATFTAATLEKNGWVVELSVGHKAL